MVVSEVLLLVSLILATVLWLWNKKSNSYFKKLKVPYIPAPLLGGHLKDMILQRKAITDVMVDIYNDPATKDEPVVGVRFLHIHGLLVKDQELIKRILVKDFNSFQNRRANSDIHSDVIGGSNMFLLKNPEWRGIRNKITPVFTGNKIRQLFTLINGVGEDLSRYLDRTIPSEKVINVKDITALFTTDVIATCAYGVQANSLQDPNSEFRRHGKKIFDFNVRRSIEFALLFFWPEISRFVNLKLFTEDSSKFLTETLVGVMDERQRTGNKRNDLIDVLIKLRKGGANQKDEDGTYEDHMLVGQAAVFFTAGFETTSSAMAFTLYELAKQPELQQRLRREIKEFLSNNKDTEITYESISQLTYLNMCCQETFRMYPPLPYLDRECTPQLGDDSYSLEPISGFKIPRGFPIYIPTYALHRDEKFFPDPMKYNPERFSEENKDSIPQYAYMPFGLGQRDCIGKRFGIMQVKLGLIHFLNAHYVEVCAETQMEVQMHRMAILTTPKDGLVLRIRKEVGAK